MTITRSELERFYQFVQQLIQDSNSDLTWQDVIDLWESDNPTLQKLVEDTTAGQQSIILIDAIGDKAMLQSSTAEAENSGLPFRWFPAGEDLDLADQDTEIDQTIKRGIRNIDEGSHRPAREVTEELRRKHGIPTE